MLSVIGNQSTAIKEVITEERLDNVIYFPSTPAMRRLAGKRPDDEVEKRVEAGSDAIKDERELTMLLEAALGCNNMQRIRIGIQMVIGCNFGLRISDIVKLRWKDLYECEPEDTGIAEHWTMRDCVVIKEEKSQKNRALYPNESLQIAVNWFKGYEARRRVIGLDINEYLFIGEKNKKFIPNEAPYAIKSLVQCPIYESTMRDDMSSLIKACNVNHRVTPHSLRKTFGYFMSQITGESEAYSNRSTSVVQKIFNHSDQRITLRYVGMDVDEVKSYYQELNLGLEVVKKYCC